MNARSDDQMAALTGRNLTGTDLSGCILAGVPAREADLRGADLRGADMRGADLRGVDLRGARMEGAVLDDATADMAPVEPTEATAPAAAVESEPVPTETEENDAASDAAPPEAETAEAPNRGRRIRSAWGTQRPHERPSARAGGRPPSVDSDGPRFITSARRTLRTQGMNKPLSEAIAEGPDAVSDYWKRLMKKAGDESATSTGEEPAAVAQNNRQRQW